MTVLFDQIAEAERDKHQSTRDIEIPPDICGSSAVSSQKCREHIARQH